MLVIKLQDKMQPELVMNIDILKHMFHNKNLNIFSFRVG